MPDSITFKRATAPDSVYLSRARSKDWQVDVRALGDKARPIVLQRDFDGMNYITLDMSAAQARALAAELLHAADVALKEQASPAKR